MARYRLSETAKEDLIRIYQYGVRRFGERQAEKYFNDFYVSFDRIADNPFAFESVDYIRRGYRRYVSGVDTVYYRLTDGVVEIMAIVGKQDQLDTLQ